MRINRRIVILGFMACGKTTVGSELARQLSCDFIDLDSFIAERHGRSAAEIIQQDGEAAFREAETLALRDALESPTEQVIALGGGTWTMAENRALIAAHNCETIWLDVPFEVCWDRIRAAKAVRPLAPDREVARSRYESRRADYALATRHIRVCDSESVEALARKIAEQIRTVS